MCLPLGETLLIRKLKGKVKVVPINAVKAHAVSRGIATPVLNIGTRECYVVQSTPRPLYSGKETPYPQYGAGWVQQQNERFSEDRKILAAAGIFFSFVLSLYFIGSSVS